MKNTIIMSEKKIKLHYELVLYSDFMSEEEIKSLSYLIDVIPDDETKDWYNIILKTIRRPKSINVAYRIESSAFYDLIKKYPIRQNESDRLFNDYLLTKSNESKAKEWHY